MNESLSRLRGRSFLVTGGTGFIGSALVRGLIRHGARVRCFDNNSRGAETKLGEAIRDVELIVGDVRDPSAVREAMRGIETVCHLAYINGTEFFYERPELILEVAVKGMINVIDACRNEGVRDLILASSSEVYQDAGRIPTPEDVPLVVPDVANPRYSYGGGKIISELLAINYGRKHFDRVVIFRPHNVYGPDMGAEHVIPQFAIRMRGAFADADGTVPFVIQGTGQETRSFIYIDDFTDGLLRVIERGEHLNIYNIGTEHEVTITDVAVLVAKCFGREIEIVPSVLRAGSTRRRCPDITKLKALGFSPGVSLEAGIATTVSWYRDSSAL
jgi:dTDP-glucose 4,6-dehydratase/UDP-glucose 4-epimerase